MLITIRELYNAILIQNYVICLTHAEQKRKIRRMMTITDFLTSTLPASTLTFFLLIIFGKGREEF